MSHVGTTAQDEKVMSIIRHAIDGETRQRPLVDREIHRLVQIQGFKVGLLRVAMLRRLMGIPDQRKRTKTVSKRWKLSRNTWTERSDELASSSSEEDSECSDKPASHDSSDRLVSSGSEEDPGIPIAKHSEVLSEFEAIIGGTANTTKDVTPAEHGTSAQQECLQQECPIVARARAAAARAAAASRVAAHEAATAPTSADEEAMPHDLSPPTVPRGVPDHRQASCVRRFLLRDGFCIAPGPILSQAEHAVIDDMVACHDGATTLEACIRLPGYHQIKNTDDEPIGKSLRVGRRFTHDEMCLRRTLSARLNQLGFQYGYRDLTRENDEITDGVTVLRCVVQHDATGTMRTCSMQRRHCDRAHEGSLAEKPLAQIPVSVVWAVQDGTTMVVEERRVAIPTGCFMLFRGDVCHRGDAYDRVHTRVHVYLDPIHSKLTSHFILGCNVSD
jgi:hypothetical protein